ncbi:hypothetical protein BH09PSE6_BH09PSE6_22720 [soil metagenome]
MASNNRVKFGATGQPSCSESTDRADVLTLTRLAP